MRIAAILLLLVAGSRPGCVSAQSVEEELRALIGTWETVDTYHPLEGQPSVETGVRTCELALRNQYLQCDTNAVNAQGTERSYRWMINYNRITERFEMLSIWSNVPFKSVSALESLEGGDGWRLTGVALVGDTEEYPPSYSEMVVESPNRIVWTGRRLTEGVSPESAPISFVETWVRR